MKGKLGKINDYVFERKEEQCVIYKHAELSEMRGKELCQHCQIILIRYQHQS